jgi:ABC-type Na+ efflux pump permease subunit
MRRIVAGVGGLGLAVMLSQFPEYAQQYTQRLGGAVDELRVITEEFDSAAAAGGLDRAAAIGRYEASNDDFLAGRGVSMTATFARYEQLSATLARIENAGAVERIQSLPAYLDTDIGQRTLENYRWAVPFTMEGILYAGGGFILGYLILSGLWRFATMPFKKRYPAYR